MQRWPATEDLKAMPDLQSDYSLDNPLRRGNTEWNIDIGIARMLRQHPEARLELDRSTKGAAKSGEMFSGMLTQQRLIRIM
jgi:hypothetical protein